jgi:hypothetical protein
VAKHYRMAQAYIRQKGEDGSIKVEQSDTKLNASDITANFLAVLDRRKGGRKRLWTVQSRLDRPNHIFGPSKYLREPENSISRTSWTVEKFGRSKI